MGKRLCRIVLLGVLLGGCAVLLGGCWAMSGLMESAAGDNMDYGYTTGTDMRESVSEGYFRLTIHTDKDEFKQGETIDCWAEVEYIGDKDSITVYTYGNLIGMDMTGGNVYYSSSDSAYKDGTLTLKKGEPYRCTLAEVLPKSKSVLPAQYEIDAYTNIGLSPDGAVSYNGYVSAVIVVSK